MNQASINNKNHWFPHSLRTVVYLVIIALTMGVWPTIANPNKELIQKLPVLSNSRHQEILYKLVMSEIATSITIKNKL